MFSYPFAPSRELDQALTQLHNLLRRLGVTAGGALVDQAGEQAEELIVHIGIAFLDQHLEAFGVDQCRQGLFDELHLPALLIEHLLGDALVFKNGLEQALVAQELFRSQRVAATSFLRQPIHQPPAQVANDLLLFVYRDLLRHVHAQESMGRVVVKQRRANGTARATARTDGHIDLPRQQRRLDDRILANVDDAEDLRRVGSPAVRAIDANYLRRKAQLDTSLFGSALRCGSGWF